ncbi:MAG: hypothetical protein R3F37_03780 [Candidatus Competibacteraceae bacterium]
MNPEKMTWLEKIAGNPVSALTAAAAGASIAGMPGALLPVLINTLAHGRYVDRQQRAITQVVDYLNSVEEKLRVITDEQYKLINETVSTILHTTEEEKLEILQTVIHNVIDFDDVTHHDSYLISRIIRDISVSEAKFFLESSYNGDDYSRIFVGEENPSDGKGQSTRSGNKITATLSISFVRPEYVKNNILYLSWSSQLVDYVTGLLSLGLVKIGKVSPGGNLYVFSLIAEKVRRLLRK